MCGVYPRARCAGAGPRCSTSWRPRFGRTAGLPDFVYDEKHDLYRFPDGEFAFSREYANERRLREMGIIG
jgi:hypothetical protein